jgi:hypothetical protein
MRTLILVGLISLVGCGAAKPDNSSIRVEIDDSFSPEKVELVFAALESWKSQVGSSFDYRPFMVHGPAEEKEDNTVRILNVEPVKVNDLATTYGHDNYLDGTPSKFILIDQSLAPNDFQGVLCHELGHALGITPHYKGTEPSVMRAGFVQGQAEITPQPVDVAAYWAAQR